MLIVGLLSILQITVLPGYLLVRALRMDEGAIKTWTLSFTISLLINHLIVFALVAFHVYFSWAFYFILPGELGILAWMEYRRFGTPIATLLSEDRQRMQALFASLDGVPTRRIGTLTLFAAAVTFLVYFIHLAETSHIFNDWDAVVSWNRWAVDWYHNQLPTNTHQYPQLIPSNWSISYIFLGSPTVQLFAKLIMSFFPITILLIVADLGLRLKNPGFFFAVGMTGLLALLWGGNLLDSGYADTPLAFMALASVYMLLLAKQAAPGSERFKNLFVGAILCAAAALTKQPGLYLAALYPLLSFVLVLNDTKESFAARVRTVALLYVTLTVLIAPWEIHTWREAISGADSSPLSFLTVDVHEGRIGVERFIFGVQLIAGSLGTVLTCLVIPLGLFFALSNRVWRWILLGLIVPWFLIWAFLFSYDLRNLGLIVALVGVAAGIGLYDGLSPYVGRFMMIGTNWQVRIAVTLAASAILLLNFRYPAAKLVRHQLELQRDIYNPVVNRTLYDYQEKHGFKGTIATSYQVLGYLPGLEKYYGLFEGSKDPQEFLMNAEKLDAAYLLWRDREAAAYPDVAKFIREKIASGEYILVFDVDGFELVDLQRH